MTRINDWGETLRETVTRSIADNRFTMRAALPGEIIDIGIGGGEQLGLQPTETRVLSAKCIGPANGVIKILNDTAPRDSWAGRYASIGSVVFSAGGLRLLEDGLLRGVVAQGQGVAICFNASLCPRPDQFDYLLAEYQSLTLEGQKIF